MGMSRMQASRSFSVWACKREINPVHGFAAQRRIHNRRRKRMLHRVSCNPVHARGRIHLLNAISAAQFLRRHLSGRCLLIFADGAKGENAARPHPQYAADDPLLAHAQPDQGILVAVFLQKLHHRHVVRECGSGGDNLVEIRRDGDHLLQRMFQVLGGAKVVRRKNQSRPAAQTLQLRRFALSRALQFEVEQLASPQPMLWPERPVATPPIPGTCRRDRPPAGG